VLLHSYFSYLTFLETLTWTRVAAMGIKEEVPQYFYTHCASELFPGSRYSIVVGGNSEDDRHTPTFSSFDRLRDTNLFHVLCSG
jgi:hypothetical protein